MILSNWGLLKKLGIIRVFLKFSVQAVLLFKGLVLMPALVEFVCYHLQACSSLPRAFIMTLCTFTFESNEPLQEILLIIGKNLEYFEVSIITVSCWSFYSKKSFTARLNIKSISGECFLLQFLKKIAKMWDGWILKKQCSVWSLLIEVQYLIELRPTDLTDRQLSLLNPAKLTALTIDNCNIATKLGPLRLTGPLAVGHDILRLVKVFLLSEPSKKGITPWPFPEVLGEQRMPSTSRAWQNRVSTRDKKRCYIGCGR